MIQLNFLSKQLALLSIFRKAIFIFYFFIFAGQCISGSDLNSIQNTKKSIENFDTHENDSSGYSSDGPVIIYDEEKIFEYSIIPEGKNNFKAVKKVIDSKDSLFCYIDETGQQFGFKLKDEIRMEDNEYELPEKMLIISDIEGNFKGFTMILKGSGVINDEMKWVFGNGHLVLPGDFFDRGINVTECLWLIYKLESEAESQGGKVHFILGNHEVMNLRGKFKYVRSKYFANADSMDIDYKNWYSKNSELGRWLRSKNGAEKIGDFLFLHAGISKDFPKDSVSLLEINNNIRLSIDKEFKEGEASKDIFIGSESPIWYRGIVDGTETTSDVEKTLAVYNASKMIIGHTIVDQIKYLQDGKVIAIDLDHQENTAKGIMYALLFKNGNFFVIDSNGIRSDLK